MWLADFLREMGIKIRIFINFPCNRLWDFWRPLEWEISAITASKIEMVRARQGMHCLTASVGTSLGLKYKSQQFRAQV